MQNETQPASGTIIGMLDNIERRRQAAIENDLPSGSGDALLMLYYLQITALRREASEYCQTNPGATDEDLEQLFYEKCDRLEDEMMQRPALTARDFAAKALIASCRFEQYPTDNHPVVLEALRLVGEIPPEDSSEITRHQEATRLSMEPRNDQDTDADNRASRRNLCSKSDYDNQVG